MLGGRRGIPFTMEEIFDYMGFDYLRYSNHRTSFNIPCPICDRSGKNKHLNVNLEKKIWRCPKCGSFGNAVNYYRLVTTGRYEMSKEEYSTTIKTLREALGFTTESRQQKGPESNRRPTIPSAPIATDEELDRTFQRMLSFSAFSLTDDHRNSLLKRGLTIEAIEQNGYRSFPDRNVLAKHILRTINRQYQKNDWMAIRSSDPMLKRQSDTEVKFGLSLAEWLQKQGCDLEGVPGFYKFCKRWCFLCPASGIMIPTRNKERKIVGIQIRTDSGRVRYMTLSSKGLEMAVASGISRVHWPLQNAEICPFADDQTDQRAELLITEGPLKADVAQCLISRLYPSIKTAFVAIQGINNTSPLFSDLDKIREETGLVRVINALDMDRLTNINVMRGSRKLRENLIHRGLEFKTLLWDQESALNLCEKYQQLFKTLNLKPPSIKNPFLAIAKYCTIMEEMKGDPASRLSGKEFSWPSDSKGIDDYLLQILKTSLEKSDAT